MAINTRSKLNSMISFGDVWHPAIPIPHGAFTQGDLQHILHGYSGVLWTASVVHGDTIVGIPCLTISSHSINLSLTSSPIELTLTEKPITIGITGGQTCQ